MKTSQVFYVLLVLVLIFVVLAPASSTNLIQNACQPANKKDVCVRTIKSFPVSTNTTVLELANIVLKQASEKAVNATTHIKALLSNASSLEPTVYQRINECSVHFQDAVDMVDNSMAALYVKAYDDVTRFLTVALADAAACEDGIKTVGPKELVAELSNFDRTFKRLCNVALVITKATKTSN
ncbi:hypothetical protein QQ045_009200 [Rhodiola kirilowii]